MREVCVRNKRETLSLPPSPARPTRQIVLDESPTCVKHLIHTLLKGGCSKTAMATTIACLDGGSRLAATAPAAVAADEETYLLYISLVLGLSDVVAAFSKTQGMEVIGGTTIASPLQLPRWSRMLQSWLPGQPAGLSLLYRASRDGFATVPFQKRVRGVRETITLIRVKSGSGRVDSVVGGYTDIELVPHEIGIETGNRASDSAFLFLLHSPDENSSFEPAGKWSLKQGEDVCAIHWPDTTDDCAGPAFGLDDMCVTFSKDGSGGACNLSTRGEFYAVGETSPFLNLDGNSVTEIEVFRVGVDVAEEQQQEQPAPVATTPSEADTPSDRSSAHYLPASADEMEEKYARKFGASLAELLMEEQMALAYAQTELREAKIRAAAAAEALTIVYGPKVARGDEDCVVELSVRGMSVTTLRSTLEVCPDSVFPAWLSERSGPESDDDDGCGKSGLRDEDGRLKVDCDPNCFSKILDVMRMRKRAVWAADEGKDRGGVGGHTIRISIPENDRGCFEEAVHTFFPGCEEFIMGLIETWNDTSARVFMTPSFRGAGEVSTASLLCNLGLRGKSKHAGQSPASALLLFLLIPRKPVAEPEV